MLSQLAAQAFAGISLSAIVGGFLVGRWLSPPNRQPVRVAVRRERTRWTEAVWVGGSFVASFWSVGVLLVPRYAYDWPSLPDFPSSAVVQLFGFLVSLVGGLLFFAAVRALGRHMTPAIQLQEGHRLVREGPYRFIRHPAYTAIITGASGLSVLYLSSILALITVVLVGMAVYRAHLEEGLLSSSEGFGETYRAYMGRTGRFLPRIRSRPSR